MQPAFCIGDRLNNGVRIKNKQVSRFTSNSYDESIRRRCSCVRLMRILSKQK